VLLDWDRDARLDATDDLRVASSVLRLLLFKNVASIVLLVTHKDLFDRCLICHSVNMDDALVTL
jgi:hypothetical protein